MTSFTIIPHKSQKVNPKITNFGAFAPKLVKNTSQIPAKRCEAAGPHALNSWTALYMSFEWHGDDVASFDNQIHTLVCRNDKEATFRHLTQPATRVIMCASLLSSIIARTTYDLTSHNGEISFVNGRVHTFRAYTDDDGQRVVQEKRGKKKWRMFGTINPNGTVTPIIGSHLPSLAADDDPRYAHEAKKAQREIRVIKAKANLINKPAEMMSQGVAVSFKGRKAIASLRTPKASPTESAQLAPRKSVKRRWHSLLFRPPIPAPLATSVQA